MQRNKDVLAAVRRKYGHDLGTLADVGFGPAGSADAFGYRDGPRRLPSLVRRSILSRSVDVKLVVSYRSVDLADFLSGPYPKGSIMVATSVSARQTLTNRPTWLDPREIDAWGVALAASGFEEYVLNLGEMAAYTSGARHYRYVIGPDRCMCVIPQVDRETLHDLHQRTSSRLLNQLRTETARPTRFLGTSTDSPERKHRANGT
ncbi:hypothetical protein XU06_29760 (plasmid) [Rhodococcus erythropolis]|nr:hypothetical protein XU06_29760 [Rhodococcus erythropolis]